MPIRLKSKQSLSNQQNKFEQEPDQASYSFDENNGNQDENEYNTQASARKAKKLKRLKKHKLKNSAPPVLSSKLNYRVRNVSSVASSPSALNNVSNKHSSRSEKHKKAIHFSENKRKLRHKTNDSFVSRFSFTVV